MAASPLAQFERGSPRDEQAAPRSRVLERGGKGVPNRLRKLLLRPEREPAPRRDGGAGGRPMTTRSRRSLCKA
jgi:hypothetical protein